MVEIWACAHTLNIESVFWCFAAAYRLLLLVYNFLLRLGEVCVCEPLECLEGVWLKSGRHSETLKLHSQILPLFYEAVGRMVCSEWCIEHLSLSICTLIIMESLWSLSGLKASISFFSSHFSRLKVAHFSLEDKSVSSLCCTQNTAVSSASCNTVIKPLVVFTVLIIHCRINVLSYNLFLSKGFLRYVITYLRAGPWYHVCDFHPHNAHW